MARKRKGSALRRLRVLYSIDARVVHCTGYDGKVRLELSNRGRPVALVEYADAVAWTLFIVWARANPAVVALGLQGKIRRSTMGPEGAIPEGSVPYSRQGIPMGPPHRHAATKEGR